MRGHLIVKPGVAFTTIAPAGFRLVEALNLTARRLALVLKVTCGCEAHPPLDPHTLGEAYDVQTHGFTDDQKRVILKALMQELADGDVPGDVPFPADGGIGTAHFWGWIEHPGEPNEHLHCQRRKGTVYP